MNLNNPCRNCKEHEATIPKFDLCDACISISVVLRDGKGVISKVLYTPSPKQQDFHARIEPNVLFWGGRGSGKSLCGRWDAHMRALAYPGFRYCILRRTYPELERSHLVDLPAEMHALGGYYNHTSHTAHYPNGSTGKFAQCQGQDDVLKLLSSEYAYMFFDELSTFEWEHFTMLSASVRVKKDSGLIAMVRAATNPLGIAAQDVMSYFVSKDVDPLIDSDYNPNDWHSIHANAVDNPYLDLEQYKKRFAGLPPNVRKAWVEGEFEPEFVLFDFKPFKTVETEDGPQKRPYHVVNDLDLKKIIDASVIYRAVDVGWHPDPSVVLWIAHLGNRHIVFHEIVHHRKTAAELAELILEEDKILGVKKVAMTYCDPSMDINTTADVRTVREIFEANGIPMECSVNKRDMFASAIHEALNSEVLPGVPRIQFFDNHHGWGCPYLIKSIPQMKYDDKKPMFMADHKHDHPVVALAYYLMSHSSDPRSAIQMGGSHVPKWMRPKPGQHQVLGRYNVRDRR